MHKAYSLNFTLKTEKKCLQIGKDLYSRMKHTIDDNLSSFYTQGKLDGTKLSEEWFPQISADIFVSHSHKDFDTALVLAGWLYDRLGIVCFIDSCVWGYSEKLLKAIDNRFCKNDDDSYNYEKRNYSTAHVYMMLTVALTRMINNCECLFFLNTPNSILPENSVKDRTLSPWIYTECSMISLIKERSPREHRVVQENFSKSMESLKIAYDLDTNLQNLPFEQLTKWVNQNFQNKYQALDYLYQYLGKDGNNVIYG